jgi:TP901 family phage tail tape measure protein
MANNNIEINVDLEIKQATKKINELEKEVKGLASDLKQANADKLNTSLKKVDTTTKSLLPQLTKLAGTIGVGMIATKAIESMAEFQASISKLGAISQASKEQLASLRDEALELGAKTQYSATQVAEGMNYLAMAGFKTNEILKSTATVLNLATVGQMDLGRASDISSNILSGFGLKANDLKRVVDDMSATITNSNTDISQMGEAMKYVAPVASKMGVSVEETATAIGILGNAGIQGTMAGTGLSSMLTRMSSPTGQAKQMIEQLNVKLFDSKGKFIGLKQALQEFADKTESLSQQDRLTAYKTIFGEEALKSVLTLTSEVDKSYDKLGNKVKDSAGLSDKVAKQMQDNLKGDWQKLLSALDGLAQTIGEDLLPALQGLVQNLTSGVSAVTDFYKEHRALIKTLAELGTTLLLVNKSFKIFEAFFGAKALKSVLTMGKSISKVGKGLVALKTATSGAMSAFLAVNPVLLALGITLAGVIYYTNELAEANRKLKESTDKLNDSTTKLKDLNEEIKKLGNNTATKKDLEDLKNKTEDLIKTNKERIKQIKEVSDGSRQYNEEIAQLTNQNKTLNEVLAKTNEKLKNKDYKIEETKQATSQTKLLTEAQKKYIDSLDKELQSQTKRKQTLQEWYQSQLNTLNKMLKGHKEYIEAKEKIDKLYNLKLEAQYKITTDKLKQEYTKRVSDREQTISKLEAKEKTLANKIIEINKQLAEKLKQIENSRVLEIQGIEDSIHNLQIAGLSSYQQYNDKKLQADKKLAQAKEALEKGNLNLAKTYMGQYRSIAESLANTEIKNGKRVVVSKKQSNAVAIEDLRKLEGVTNEYYIKQKEEAKSLHDQKLNEIKIQLQATREQIKLEVQRLELDKQMIEMLTGKKVTIDTTSALASIKALDDKIKGIDKQIKDGKKVNLSADTQNVDKTLNNVKNKKADIKVGADTSEANSFILKVKDTITGKTENIKVGADTKKAKDIIIKVKDSITGEEQKIKISANANKAFETINKLKQPTSSTHTIYVKEVKQKAIGGLITPLKRATGGDIDLEEFKRVNGRIAGYDPTDSDSVPAMLTQGEFVIKRDAVAHYGDSLLWALNNKQLSKDMLPKFYTGGMVQQGTPQKLITEISNNISSDSGNNSNSNLDDLIQKLQDLIDSFKGQNVPIVSTIQQEINKIKDDKAKFTKDYKELEDFKNSTKGKTLSKDEYSKYRDNLNTKKGLVDKDDEVAKKLKDEVAKIVEKVKNYLQQVANVKKQIEAKFSDLDINIPETLKNKISNSFDLGKLFDFNNKISNLENYENKIKKDLKDKYWYYKQISNQEAKGYYSGLGSVASGGHYTEHNEEMQKYYSEMNDENYIKKKAVEELMKHLPKFQNGGLLQLQSGGKLEGYGGGDRNLALLEDGEFVIRKEAVASFGADLFHNLNNLKLPKFQNGGIIGNIPSANNSPSDLVNVNFNMPNGKNFKMQSSEDIARALASELKRIE